MKWSEFMKTDTIVRREGIEILLKALGKVDAERFISLIIREPFDYTDWQSDLFADLSIRELSDEAMRMVKK